VRKWILRGAAALAVLLLGLGVAGWYLARRVEPFVREQAIRYLETRFGTGVELGSLRVSVSLVSPLQLRAAVLRVNGERLVLPFRGNPDLPPLITVGKFHLETEVGAVWNSPRHIRDVRLESVEINIPPREIRRAALAPQTTNTAPKSSTAASVVVDTIRMDAANLRIYPSDPAKQPRLFEIHKLTLHGTSPGRPLTFKANLTNPTPPGVVQTTGAFGPWKTEDPGLTPISGDYTFDNADLGVFKGIAGILDSTGRYDGVLRRIEVHGETRTPKFHMPGGNPVPLTTRFHSIVDGTSGDTYLQPVRATLGRSNIVASGSVVRHEGAKRRTVSLDVSMNNGLIEDLLGLAVKAPEPFMRGEIDLRTKMEILPRAEAFSERLLLAGTFNVDQAHFLAGSVQEKIDSLSRRAQGQPKNQDISDVLSAIRGGFDLRDGEIKFSALTFRVPGAAIHLKGAYGMYSEEIDMHGVARLQAKVSQTMTGWKRLVLKPVDPFFSKAGAGTLLPIKIAGTRAKPEFGLDRGSKRETNVADRRAPEGSN